MPIRKKISEGYGTQNLWATHLKNANECLY
jgi:hypothetical protein